MLQISVAQLYEDNRDPLGLAWIGGKASGAKRMENLTEEQRRDIASKAARKRWAEVAKRKAIATKKR